MGCDQAKAANKFPQTEDDKKNMTQPYAVEKCPKQYITPHLESNSKKAKSTITALAGYLRTNRSAMEHIKALNSPLSSSQPLRKITICVNAVEAKISPFAMELIRP